jgi:hypothetical protein
MTRARSFDTNQDPRGPIGECKCVAFGGDCKIEVSEEIQCMQKFSYAEGVAIKITAIPIPGLMNPSREKFECFIFPDQAKELAKILASSFKQKKARKNAKDKKP